MSRIRLVYISTPLAKSKDEEAEREARIAELSERVKALGLEPVSCRSNVQIGERIETLISCDGMLLDSGWKRCRACLDEHAIASNHKLTFFHTKEEWSSLLDSYVI